MLMRPLGTVLAFLLLAASLHLGTPPAQAQYTSSLERQIFRAFDAQDHALALSLINQHLEQRPDDNLMLYNAACAHCLLGNREQAAAMLHRAVKAGFLDFGHMRLDPDLECIRDHQVYQAILEAAATVARRSASSAVDRWRRRYGEQDYRYDRDDDRRLVFATALADESHEEMKEMLAVQSDHLLDYFFEAPPGYYVLIAIPTPSDANEIFGGRAEVGGMYEHHKHRLVARNIGGSLRHEFFHALHYGHMDRLQQSHELWIQEGMASLYEDYDLDDNGGIVFLPNSRHNITHSRARAGRLLKWEQLFELSDTQFMRRAGSLYPQVRSIFEYVHHNGLLRDWYQMYVRHFNEDPTGKMAFETVFEKPLPQIERDWRRWVINRPKIDLRVDAGDAALGITSIDRLSNDGVLITQVFRDSGASIAKLRVGDVIVSIDETPTRSMPELVAVIASLDVGDTVTVRYRRDDTFSSVPVTLRSF
ncbi:MAG: PDZ domain-containing protein [Deltaproteobacteria bacterium]|jgi:hypothetical protein|nr:PDZ domain-containing protein [Deltaproteobacteria bacterium]